jgi:predicted anti-sigma-YlaC factor YlaD
MCEKELLVAYLYEDLSGADRAAFEAHLRECAECRDELKALGAVRMDLAAWAVPQSDLGFRVVRGASDTGHVLRMPVLSWRAWWTPAAGLAAAAVLVLAAASAIARVEVHSGPDGVTVRTGWSAFAPASGRSFGGTSPAGGTSASVIETGVNGQVANAPVLAKAQIGEGVLTADVAFVAELERRLTALEAAASRDSGMRNASTLSARASDTEIIKRVRELLAQSESKQQGELALRISQVIRDVDAQRAADLARIQRGLGRIDATVAEEAASHRDLTNFILASAKQK